MQTYEELAAQVDVYLNNLTYDELILLLKESGVEFIMKPQKISKLDLAFGGSVKSLMPNLAEIPKDFKQNNSIWKRVFDSFFFDGVLPEFEAKAGIDYTEAIEHVMTIARSFEPKHEDKELACAYLMSLWFNDPKSSIKR